MKTHKLLPFFFFIFTHLALGQITFQKSFYDTIRYAAQPFDIKETFDGGYILTGLSDTSSFLMKLDRNGDSVWTKFFVNGWGPGQAWDMVLQACDSGYIGLGLSMRKSDINGNVIWSKQYPYLETGSYKPGYWRTNDCEYILACFTDSLGAGGYDFYVIKTDTGGNPLLSRTYGGTGDDEATSIQQTADGGYIIAGFTNSFDTVGYKTYLIKTDANGDTLWTKTYRSPIARNTGDSYSVQQTYDHGYILFGSDYLIKTDSTGNVIWSKTYNGRGGQSIRQTLDSGYILLDLNLLIKLNRDGDILWANSFPQNFEGYIEGNTVLQTNDAGYIITDCTHETQLLYPSVYIDLIKTNADGQSGCNENTTTITASNISITASGTNTVVTSPITTVTASSINTNSGILFVGTNCSNVSIPEPRMKMPPFVFPNPVSQDGCINIYSDEDLKGVELTIFNMIGEVLSSEIVKGNGRAIILSLKGKLSTGMYFLRIKEGNNVCVQKLVVMK